jgi:hypothetical protein
VVSASRLGSGTVAALERFCRGGIKRRMAAVETRFGADGSPNVSLHDHKPAGHHRLGGIDRCFREKINSMSEFNRVP